MRAEKIRQRLAQGPATWDDLAAVSGHDKRRCQIEVNRLQRECGCTIEKRRVTYLIMMYDPENPAPRICAWDGCDAPLRTHNGTGYCAIHTQLEARRRWLAMSRERRAEMAEEICGDPAAILVLFDNQLSLDGTPA